ncbi:hypothetical protein CLV47_10661 [Antricoccus suffuscus]|uniref:Uncharacterized protein n=1 Tax=Antricoccus suffuscus TaxID=1629062 RepID=A0A2T1A0Q7_9ACTN|nr:hypothetical protein CLV47_10661 [Antricoccus suffuscus]
MLEATAAEGASSLRCTGLGTGVGGTCVAAGTTGAATVIGVFEAAVGSVEERAAVVMIDAALAGAARVATAWGSAVCCHQSAAAPTIGITSTTRDTAHTVGARNGWWVSSAC